MHLKVKRIRQGAKLPIKATEGSICYDVFSAAYKILLSTMEKAKIPTGLAFELPPGMGLEIRPRSSLADKGLIILNSPGTLDSDYRGELFIICQNLSIGNILINMGDRIAQIRLIRSMDIEFEEVEELSRTERGEGGFGSTGR